MKTLRLTRRQFFKVSAFGTGALVLPALGLSAVAATPSREAQAAAEQPDGPAVPQPTFTPIASNTTFGPLTAVAMGWDGALWGIDASGAPHVYDAINDAWAQHGDGIDAAASDNQMLYLFRGSQVVTFDLTTQQTSTPADIATTWPNLPDTFKLGVDGASYDQATQTLYLFDGGRYAPADGSAPPKPLTGLTNWPANDPTFGAGVIHGVFSALQSDGTTITFLLRGAQALRIDLATATVTDVPQPFTNYYDYATFLPSDFRINGLDAGVAVVTPGPSAFTNYMYRGAGIVTWSRGSPYPQVAQYIASVHANWPASWHPVLLQAPSGRDGYLWSVVATAGYAAGTGQVIQHNGEAWAVPAAGTIATSVSAGQDGAVIHVQPDTSSMFTWNGSGWSALGSVPAQLQQVSLGGTNDVWLRDTNNNVYSYDFTSNTFTQSATVGQAAHIAATGDGTLWHARSNDANAYRLLAGQNLLQPAIPVQQGIVTSVQRVTGTGFGTAYCLAQTGTSINLYRYDSPYVFKSQYGFTPIPGSTLVEALGEIYFTNALDFNGDNYPVVALDAHTGAVRSQSAPVSNPLTTTGYTPPVFDPVNELIYVGITQPYDSSQNNIGPGQIIALDAHDLSRVVWSFATEGYVDAGLTVIDQTLLAGDRTGRLYVFDTAAAAANPSQAAPTATVSLPLAAGRPPQADAWYVSKSVILNQSYFMILWALNEAAFFLIQLDPSVTPLNGTASQIQTILPPLSGVPWLQTTLAASPIVINSASDGSATFAVNAINSVVLVQPSGQVTKGFALPSGSLVYGGLTLDTDNGQLWFGDDTNTLYCLDAQLRAVNYTPFSVSSDDTRPILSTPVLYRDTGGGKTIFTSVLQTANVGYLYGFDPDNGNLVSLPTGDTQITAFSQGIANGVLYVGGVTTDPSATTSLSQLFGLRVDDLVQGERDFIIESQLMQDPDQNATNGSADPSDPIPPSAVRYQTHISVVDDQKTPRTNEPVKIWADTPGTVITIDDQQYTIGPGDGEFAQTQTGPDGTVVVMSDATDVNASALRAWASFMDPYERIVVYPDHEWHGRVTASYNDPNASVTQPDPTRPNLSTVHTYSTDPATNAPKQLFTPDEKTDQYPAAMASAIAQMQAGLNPGGNSAAALAGSLKTQRATDSAASYIAYSDLGGMHYAPSNALVQRTATTVAPFGLMWDTDDSGKSNLSILSHFAAADEIDAITGTPWTPSALDFGAAQADGVLRVHSWGSFWHHVRHAVESVGAKIKKVVVSAADKIKAAIAYVANGVTTFFKTVIEVVEDVVESIGAFFLQLGKLIEDVIEALSLLFHFGEILKTQGWIRNQINTLLGQVVSSIDTDVQNALNAFFNEGGEQIKTSFETIRQSLGINDDTQINDLSNARSTAHTVFKAGNSNAGPTSGGASQAVPATHGLQKFKSALPSAKLTLPFAAARPGAAGGSPTIQPSDAGALATFITGFVNDVQSDSNLSSAFSALTSSIGGLVAPTSASDFFKSALNALLSVVETLIIGAITLSKALVSGLFGVLSALIGVVTDLLNAPIDIPFFSWLYKILFGQDLSLINLITLVAAIPVTLIYRIAYWRYPSQDGFSGAQAGQIQRGKAPADVDDTLKKIQGILGAVFGFGLGLSRMLADVEAPEPETGVLVCVLLCGLGYILTYFPLFIPSASPKLLDWEAWAFGMIMTLFGVLPLIPVFEDDPVAQAVWGALQISLAVCMAIGRFALYLVKFILDSKFNFLTDLLFARNLMLVLGPMFAWLKTLQGIFVLVLAGIDFIAMGLIVAAIDFVSTIGSGSVGPLPRRQFFPWVPYYPSPAQAHP